ncbi:MAG TPA: helix-turn-helix transcriptional regulator [Acidimicrobiales bacterium]|nr:helix-turn-helix transcriptional regulator [Acidimicrobiales bacterium]
MAAPTWSAALDVVHSITSVDSLDDFGPAVLHGLDRLIGCDSASFNEVDPFSERAAVVFHPDRTPQEQEQRAWSRWSHQHPMLMYMLRTGDGSTQRLSDHLTRDELHALELYKEVYAALHTEFQLAMALPAPRPVVVGVALNRGSEDFTDDEIAIGEALRPHILQAYRRVQLIAEQRSALDRIAGALADEGRAFHFVGTPLERPAAALLDRHFGRTIGGGLPAPVMAWLQDERAAFASGPVGRLRHPLVSTKDHRRLVVHFLPGCPGEPEMLSLNEGRAEFDAVPLCRLGLSPRQAEVLWRLTKGTTTADIASELGVAGGTVKKHLDQIYRKLGVSSRAAAVAQAFDAMANPASWNELPARSLGGDSNP